MKTLVLGAAAALALTLAATGARANDDLLCKGVAANQQDMLVVQTVLTPDGISKGGIATLWIGGMRKDAPASALLLYDLKDGAIGEPDKLTIYSKDPAAAKAVWVVVSFNGADYKARWKPAKGATASTALIPDALQPLLAAQKDGFDLTITLQDKSGQALVSGQVSLLPRRFVDAAADRAFKGAQAAQMTKNPKLCVAMQDNVNESEFFRTMHDNDWGMENKATQYLQQPGMGGGPH